MQTGKQAKGRMRNADGEVVWSIFVSQFKLGRIMYEATEERVGNLNSFKLLL